jgi:hypothetical protein
MKNVEVEKPVVHYEEKLINTPVTVEKDVRVQVRTRWTVPSIIMSTLCCFASCIRSVLKAALGMLVFVASMHVALAKCAAGMRLPTKCPMLANSASDSCTPHAGRRAHQQDRDGAGGVLARLSTPLATRRCTPPLLAATSKSATLAWPP